MARISIVDVEAWVEPTKIPPTALDLDHLDQLETEVLARIGSAYDTTTWLDKASTPRLIQVIIAKIYTGWLYDKLYSENQSEPNSYANTIKDNAEMLISGIINGTIEVPGATNSGAGQPIYYPNDASSAQCPDDSDPSLGPAYFSMGKRF